MSRVLSRYVPLEMAALGLLELMLSFVLIAAALNEFGSLVPFASIASAAPFRLTNFAAILAITTGAVAVTSGLYRPEVCLERRRMFANAVTAGIIAFPAVLLISDQFHIGLSSRVVLAMGGLLVVWQVGILVTHLLFSAIIGRDLMLRRILIVGSDHRAAELAAVLRGPVGRMYQPVCGAERSLPTKEQRDHRIWGVVVAAEPSDAAANAAVSAHRAAGLQVFRDATFLELYLGRIRLEDRSPQLSSRAEHYARGNFSDGLKRMLDVLVSLALLVLTLPVMLLTALLIRLDSPGPVFYRQQRVGLHGKPFTLFKFRSMSADAEAGGKPRWTQRRDPRITRLGKLIRPMRIDELPQLLNVLRGEMSIIGPRPERPHFVEQLEQAIPLYRERSRVKPGITGWAQVNYPYGASVEDAREKLAYDLYYLKNHSLLLDLRILFATVRVILFREGAR